MENNPRIYLAIGTFFPLIGGAETQAHAHCQRLRARDYEATIVTFHHDKGWPREEVIEGVPVIRVAGRLLGDRERLPRILQRLLYALALCVMAWRLWQHRHHYDILHVSQFGILVLPLTVVCLLAGKGMVIVVVGAGMPDALQSGHRSLLAGPLDATAAWLQIDGANRVSGDLNGLERFGKVVVLLTRFLLQRLNAQVIVLSTRVRSYIAEHGFGGLNSELISNGVDTSRFTPHEIDMAGNEQVREVVCVSRLSYEKGIDVLLQAWRLVREQLTGVRLIIVGAGPLQCQLERLAGELQIADSVEFTGLRNDVPALLRQYCVGILPSRCEGMPNALLEMMASGLACVATRVSGSEDAIQHGVNGLLVEPEDYQNMAQALLFLLQSPALVQEYGRAARSTIEKHYSFEYITAQYLDLYQRIAATRLSCSPLSQASPISAAQERPIRVLMVTGIYPRVGKPHSGTFIKTQVDSLVAEGLEVEVIHPRPGPVPFRYVSAMLQVFFKTLSGRFDIVHGHYGQWCLFARMQWMTPVVASFLGSDVLGEVTEDGERSMKGKLTTRLCQWLASRVDVVTVKSEQMKKVIPGDNVVVYADGIDFTLFRPGARAEARAALGWEQGRYYVLFGNDPKRPEKNFSLAEAAIARLREKGISAELIVANGLPQDALVQYINASNALILPSISEGSPNIVKEAMACNVPVVATDVGDVAELVGRTKGCSVCPHDSNALANALVEALQYVGPTTGRDDISHLDSRVVARQIVAIYKRVIHKESSEYAANTPLEGEKVHG